eukprot:m.522823 g.522823  ORF g.522823 m.522823 type:complete len:469 (+) comp21970_c1_seq5:149-1555(+)
MSEDESRGIARPQTTRQLYNPNGDRDKDSHPQVRSFAPKVSKPKRPQRDRRDAHGGSRKHAEDKNSPKPVRLQKRTSDRAIAHVTDTAAQPTPVLLAKRPTGGTLFNPDRAGNTSSVSERDAADARKARAVSVKPPVSQGTSGGASVGHRVKTARWPLIDDHLNFADAARLALADSPGKEFLVVGVLGPHGSGKSTLMSALHGGTPDTQSVFPVETLDQLTEGVPATTGVDIAVSNERVIILDTEPMQSMALLDRFIRMDAPLPERCTSYEQAVILRSYQIAMFIMAVCDVVVVAHEWAVDASFLRFLWTAEQLLSATMLPPAPGNGPSKEASLQAPVTTSGTATVSADASRTALKTEMIFVFNQVAADYTSVCVWRQYPPPQLSSSLPNGTAGKQCDVLGKLVTSPAPCDACIVVLPSRVDPRFRAELFVTLSELDVLQIVCISFMHFSIVCHVYALRTQMTFFVNG